MLRTSLRAAALVAVLSSIPSAFAADLLIDGVPLPQDVTAITPDGAPEAYAKFLGAWVGAWNGDLRHILIVEGIDAAGEASIVYAVGDSAPADVARRWSRLKATVSGDTLTVSAKFTATYRLAARGLRATHQLGNVRSNTTLTKIELGALTRPGATIAWTSRQVEFLDTRLVENGAPVRLEVVLFKPTGPGPFPLAVFNHGSTGRGTEPTRFTLTSWSFAVADLLVERGWMVAFPQRRGRGRSDGLYDEGFAPDRARGYSCDPQLSLPGADRALGDIDAAVEALKRRTEVANGRILIGGVSRGGVLSVAYAGGHPEQVVGVINFVGGWLGEGCSTAGEINGALFQRGGHYRLPTLWLYGRSDPYYSIEHSRANFATFKSAGGLGEFIEFTVPTGNGHALNVYPELWRDDVERYLGAVATAH